MYFLKLWTLDSYSYLKGHQRDWLSEWQFSYWLECYLWDMSSSRCCPHWKNNFLKIKNKKNDLKKIDTYNGYARISPPQLTSYEFQQHFGTPFSFKSMLNPSATYTYPLFNIWGSSCPMRPGRMTRGGNIERYPIKRESLTRLVWQRNYWHSWNLKLMWRLPTCS